VDERALALRRRAFQREFENRPRRRRKSA
jgi:hypothetical protein